MNKTKHKPNHQQTGLLPHTALPIRGKTNKETNKNSAQISPYKKLTQTTGPTFSSVQFSSITQSRPALCDPMNRNTPGLPVHHHLPEFTQTHVHWVSDAIQPSHPLSSPSPPALNLSQLQGIFQGVSSLHQVAKVLEFQPQRQSSQWNIQDWENFGLSLTLLFQVLLKTSPVNCIFKLSAQTLISSSSSLPSWSSPLLLLTWIITVAFHHNFLSSSFLYNRLFSI